MSNPSNLTNLKRVIVARAHADLRRVNPRYVAAFQDHMAQSQDNLEQAIVAAEPFRTSGMPRWSELLSVVFDMEVLALKVNESLRRLRVAHDGSDFESFDYHLDHWIFQFDAYLERCRSSLLKCLRQLFKGSPDMASIQARVVADIDQMRKAIGKMRDELAHGPKDGVDATTQLWLPFLAMSDPLPFDRIFVEATRPATDSDVETARRRLRLAVVDDCSAQAFARVENMAKTILDTLPPET